MQSAPNPTAWAVDSTGMTAWASNTRGKASNTRGKELISMRSNPIVSLRPMTHPRGVDKKNPTVQIAAKRTESFAPVVPGIVIP